MRFRFLPAILVTSLRSAFYFATIAGLVEARKKAGVSQVALASQLGVRQTFISKYELGERRLDVAEFIAISRAIGADPWSLIRDAEKLATSGE